MKIIEFEDVTKHYGNVPVLQNMSFSIQKGEFVTFVGHSGSGKSTVFKVILGEEDISSGHIFREYC